ncbi:hypothetical protein [Aureibacter tunicatorum]|uniref:Uncharacterized protein n=1 Tax=Aureibacter tunicatorum TaxID=866807 RepID=A0AAE3XJW0_9BACT|nr:hypothetical protein [Aureibacter tunicatorum]MDR6237830.1 hypothetical protein [Aureibacter tunicatorum]BDD02866.1 hypothetical protein AUTU_03490 [Aureibacter tunicatorum]
MYQIKENRKSNHQKLARANTQAIQRAVGFEVEVKNWRTYDPKTSYMDDLSLTRDFTLSRKKQKKNAKMFQGRDFELTADQPFSSHSVPEFITEPFEENGSGRHKLHMAFGEISKMSKQLHDDSRSHPDMLSRLDICQGLGQILMPDTIIDALEVPDFHPQANIGMRMAAMEPLFEIASVDIRNTPLAKRFTRIESLNNHDRFFWERKSLKNAHKRARNALEDFSYAFPLYEGWQGSNELFNLFAYMIHYIECPMINYHEYVKSAFPIMARTDFFMMYRLLPLEEQDYFMADDSKMFIKLFELVKFGVYDGDAISLEEQFFEQGIRGNQYNARNYRMDGLTRLEWIRQIPQGQDLLTKRNFPDQALARELDTMGSWQKYDELGEFETSAPILEFRRLQYTDSTEDLQKMALEIFDFVVAMNKQEEAFSSQEQMKRSKPNMSDMAQVLNWQTDDSRDKSPAEFELDSIDES